MFQLRLWLLCQLLLQLRRGRMWCSLLCELQVMRPLLCLTLLPRLLCWLLLLLLQLLLHGARLLCGRISQGWHGSGAGGGGGGDVDQGWIDLLHWAGAIHLQPFHLRLQFCARRADGLCVCVCVCVRVCVCDCVCDRSYIKNTLWGEWTRDRPISPTGLGPYICSLSAPPTERPI